MTARECLELIKRYDVQIRYRQEELKRMGGGPENQAYPSGYRDSVGNPNRTDKIGDVVAKFTDMERELVSIQKKRKAIVEKIESLPCLTSVEILLWKYVHDHSFKAISGKAGYSYRHIMRIHKEAVALFGETYGFA